MQTSTKEENPGSERYPDDRLVLWTAYNTSDIHSQEISMKTQILSSVFVAALLASCASMSEPKLMQTMTKVTLVSVVANDKLYYVGDQPPKASLTDLAMNAASNDGKNVNAANRLLEKTDVFVVKAEELLAGALASAKGSTLIPKETLFSSPTYANASDDKVTGAFSMRPAGYKFVKLTDATLANLSKDVGANGLISASFLFQKAMAMGMMGTGTLGAQTTLTIQAYDTTGKMVFTKVYVGVSKSNTGVLANVYDPTKYESVVNEATQVAVDKFGADLAASK